MKCMNNHWLNFFQESKAKLNWTTVVPVNEMHEYHWLNFFPESKVKLIGLHTVKWNALIIINLISSQSKVNWTTGKWNAWIIFDSICHRVKSQVK